MIEKLEFVRITGPKDDIDRVNEKYLMDYEIHLENAMSELCDVPSIKPYVEINPNKDYLAKAETIIAMLGDTPEQKHSALTIEQSIDVIEDAYKKVNDVSSQKVVLDSQKKHLEKLIEEIEPFRLLDYDLHKILDFKYIKFRFGRIAHEYFNKFQRYGYDNLNTLFYECDRDDTYVWGVYFVPASSSTSVDAIYSSLHFERLYIADEYEGTPESAYVDLKGKLQKVEDDMTALDNSVKNKLKSVENDVCEAYTALKLYSDNFDIRKMAACTKEREQGNVFYILCGWMDHKDAIQLTKAIEEDPKVFCLIEKPDEELDVKPPTKLKNPKIFKPFEMFINMYGLPSYQEMDPTMFVAITYTLIFGIMFGDVGQGAILAVGGLILYLVKKMNLAGVIAVAGVWSTIFGFLYGSVFGNEELIEPLWRNPRENIMETLIMSVCFGVGLIIISMILHIINAIKERDWGSLLFDPSGVSGLLCYGTVVVAVLLMYFGQPTPGTILLCVLVGLPLVAIIFKEPLSRILKKKKALEAGTSVGMYLIEALVEGFDVVLSYATNTISFVRVGAFALSHAGMMSVVYILAGADSNIIVLILGNILVMGLEGLVVGIQVLRLEYYEMFSRFYKGTGKPFTPFRGDAQNKN